DAAATDGVRVDLDGCSGLVRVGDGEVTVRAGTRLWQLNALLAERGLALPILGSIAQQSVAGVVATGTHGSSLLHGNLGTLVRAVTLVDGRGDVVGVGPGDPRLDGVRVHLGALGILTEVSLEVEPAFGLVQTIEKVPVAAVARQVEAIGSSAEYVKIWWVPHTGDALVFRYRRCAPDLRRVSVARAERWVDTNLVHRLILPRMFRRNERHPEGVPRWNRLAARTLVKGPRTGPSTLMFATPDPARHDETEAAVPLAAGGEAFDRLVRCLDGTDVRVNFIAELRFVRGDTGWLSPASGRDTVQLGAYTALRAHRDRYFRAFWEAMRGLDARPHWGKWFDEVDLDAGYPQAGRFRALRDELDPDRVFGNDFTRRVFGS
ncbi:MAG: FAD-binding protein, partial [Jatrophihabitans sp.]